MTQPTLIYSQPVMRPPNPFGPVSGAQVSMELDFKVLATKALFVQQVHHLIVCLVMLCNSRYARSQFLFQSFS